MKILKKSVILCIAAALFIMLCGCSNSESDTNKPSLTGQYWMSAEYTLDEINAKFHPVFFNYEREFKEEYVSEDALHAYNVMLGYAERIFDREYYVYDYYYADWTDPPHSWLIKIVPYDMARAAEEEDHNLYITEPISLFYKEDGSEVLSTVEPYFMEQKWYADLEHELSENFPELTFELAISAFEGYYPNVLNERFDGFSDYTCVINNDFYGRADEFEYGNIIDVILPMETGKNEAAEIFEQIKPILIKYCVTEVRVFTLTEYEYIDLLEQFTVLV